LAGIKNKAVQKEVLLAIISAIGGGVLTFIINLFRESKSTYQLVFKERQEELQRLREDFEALKSVWAEQVEKTQHSKAKISDLRSQILMMQVSENSFPFPQWLSSSSDLELLSFNDLFVKELVSKFSKQTRAEITGKPIEEVLPDDLGRAFVSEANKVLETKAAVYSLVNVNNTVYLVIKYPSMFEDNIFAINGMGINFDKISNACTYE
jgi:hypothetical protein